MADLQVGIIGFGVRAGLWRHVHRPGAGSVVSVVCDVSERGQKAAREALPEALVTGNLDDLLAAGLDAVLVTTPDNMHAVIARQTLAAGVATFCEKPLDVTLEAADSILEAAFRSGTRLYIGHNMRHMPVVTQMRDLISQGAIGEVKAIWCRHFVGNGGDFYFKDWHAERKNTTGMLLQKGAHDIDVIHWLAGGYTTKVAAMGDLAVYGKVQNRRDNTSGTMWDTFSADNWPPLTQTNLNPVIDIEDISMMHMELDNGILASYQQCHFTPDYWRSYTIIGTEGRMENFGDMPGETIKVWNRRSLGGLADPDMVVEIHDGDGGHGGADPLMIKEFLRFAAEGGTTDTNPVAARQAVAAGILATESLRGDGSSRLVPELASALVEYFNAGQRSVVNTPIPR